MILPGNEVHTLPIIIFEEMDGILILKGRSIDPRVEDYFADFLPYLDNCLTNKPMDLKVDMKLEYFSTISARLLVKMFDIIKKNEKAGFKVVVNWYYETDDTDSLESGQDYSYVCKIPFNFIEVPENSGVI